MAIVIEEEKRSSNWFALVVVLTIVILVFATIYYLFFSPVPFIEKVLPSRAQSIKSITSSDFNPDAVTENTIFKSLQKHVESIQLPEITERLNPFRSAFPTSVSILR